MSKMKIDVYSIIKPEVEKLKTLGFTTASLDCRLLLSQILEKANPVYTHEQVSISKNQIISKNLFTNIESITLINMYILL